MKYITFDQEMIESILTDKGGILKKTALLLGIPYPLQKGWKEDLIGKSVNEDDYYKACEGKAPKKLRQVFYREETDLVELNSFISLQNLNSDMIISITSKDYGFSGVMHCMYYWF